MNQFEETNSLETKSPVKEEKSVEESVAKELEEKETKPKKIPKQKCYECNAKLKLIIFTCKCNHIFCHKHLGAHSHNCPYDYKNEKKKQIEENNPKIESKMERI
tara:strand:+ start:1535 stop:1846 length:312 start_codon:yes stop_codon:yes gene_type:complete